MMHQHAQTQRHGERVINRRATCAALTLETQPLTPAHRHGQPVVNSIFSSLYDILLAVPSVQPEHHEEVQCLLCTQCFTMTRPCSIVKVDPFGLVM